MIAGDDTSPHGVETPTPWADCYWLGFVKPAAAGEDAVSISGSEILAYIYNSNESGTTTITLRDDTGTGRYRPVQCGNPDTLG